MIAAKPRYSCLGLISTNEMHPVPGYHRRTTWNVRLISQDMLTLPLCRKCHVFPKEVHHGQGLAKEGCRSASPLRPSCARYVLEIDLLAL